VLRKNQDLPESDRRKHVQEFAADRPEPPDTNRQGGGVGELLPAAEHHAVLPAVVTVDQEVARRHQRRHQRPLRHTVRHQGIAARYPDAAGEGGVVGHNRGGTAEVTDHPQIRRAGKQFPVAAGRVPGGEKPAVRRQVARQQFGHGAVAFPGGNFDGEPILFRDGETLFRPEQARQRPFCAQE